MAMIDAVDIVEFARQSSVLEGEIGAEDLPRLHDVLVAGEQRLRYELRAGWSSRREPQITCTIEGLVKLECQRCLGIYEHQIKAHSTLVFVSDESKLPPIEEEDESVDYVVADKRLNVSLLLEDEVILSLPLAPRHTKGECEQSLRHPMEQETSSPFAALTKLKRT
jgi:uncharacterized protein